MSDKAIPYDNPLAFIGNIILHLSLSGDLLQRIDITCYQMLAELWWRRYKSIIYNFTKFLDVSSI